jgi:hypothetical protein
VEAGSVPCLVGVRDTKLGAASPVLVLTPTAWSAFISGIKYGEPGL